MTVVGKLQRTVSGVPDLHGFIGPAGRNALAIGRPAHRVDKIGVTVIDEEVIAISAINRVPELYGLVISGNGKPGAIGRPGDGPERAGVGLVVVEYLPV